MRLSFRRSSLSSDFFLFSVLIITIITLLSLGFWMQVYQGELQKKREQLPDISNRISSVLIDSIDYTAKYAEFIGQRIAQHNPDDYAYIAATISGKSITQSHEQNLYTTIFDWVTPDKQLRVSSKIGILPTPFDMSDRDYLQRTPLHPWVFQLSSPRIGGLSREWIIPAGMGVTNKKGDFLGTITLGFSVNGLIRRIDEIVRPNDVHYLVLDDDMRMILDSTSETSGPHEGPSLSISQKAEISDGETRTLTTPIAFRNVDFLYYKKVDHSPYIVLVGYNNSMATTLFKDIVLSRMLEFTAIGLTALFLLYMMRRRLIQPVMQLAHTANHIIKGGDVTFAPSSIREIDILGKHLQKISDYIKNEQRITSELIHKTSLLEQSTHELEIANAEALAACEAAREADRAKSEFLANMSHELRTPMNAVIGLTNILLRQEYTPEKRKEYLQVMQTSAQHLMQLINDLLDIAKLESDQTQLENTPFNLLDVINDVIAMNTLQASQKNIKLSVRVNSAPPALVWGDPGRLRQVLINLIGNAVKFTQKGHVTVALDCYEDKFTRRWKVMIAIADSGIGIPADKMHSIFDKFTQADNSIRRTHGGTGLGLSISKTLIELMQGSITVDSTYGKGSCFTLHIPFMPAYGNSVGSHAPSEAAEALPQDLHILMVEDNNSNVLVITSMLDLYGYSYELAKNGKEALDKIASTHYDLILMDVQMPEMDGWEVTRRIRADEKIQGNQRIPIIGMTAHALPGDRQRCLEAGMDDYIAKPFDSSTLLQSIKRLAANAKVIKLRIA